MAGILLARRVRGGSHGIPSFYRAAAPRRRENPNWMPITILPSPVSASPAWTNFNGSTVREPWLSFRLPNPTAKPSRLQ